MSKGVEYVISVIDRAASPLDKIINKFSTVAQGASRASSNATDSLDDIADTAHTVAHSIGEVAESIDNLPTSFNSSSSKIAQSGTSLGKMFKANFLANIGADIVSGVASLVADAGHAIIGGFFQKEKDIAGLETFLGRDAAEKLFSNVQKDAAATPFGTEGLLAVNKALVAAGLNADAARLDTLALANAISAVGGGNDELSRMAANLQQIKTVGSANAMDIKQFAMTGINIYGLLSEATGRSIDDVQEMTVSYDVLAEALRKAGAEGGMYYGAMDRQAASLPGQIDAFTENISSSATAVGTLLEPSIASVVGLMTTMTAGLPEAIQGLTPVFEFVNTAILSTIEGINSIIDGTSVWSDYIAIIAYWGDMVWASAMEIGNSVGAILDGIIEWASQSVILRDIFSFIGMYAHFTYDVISDIGTMLLSIWNNILKPILGAIETAYSWIREIITGEETVISVRSTGGDIPKDVKKAPPHTVSDVVRNNSAKEKVSSKSASSAGRGGAGRVNAGGAKPTTINITIHKLQDKIEIFANSVAEGSKRAADDLANEIVEALYSIDGKI